MLKATDGRRGRRRGEGWNGGRGEERREEEGEECALQLVLLSMSRTLMRGVGSKDGSVVVI